MQNNQSFGQFFKKHNYLLVIAAWLVTFSFIIDNYWSANSSVSAVKINMESYIQEQEKDFNQFNADSALIKKLNDFKYDDDIIAKLSKKKYFIYRYFVNDIGLHQLLFWNTQSVLPNDSIILSQQNTGFILLENGYYVWKRNKAGKEITIALIPVKWNYFITNNYLQNSFVTGSGIENKYDISTNPNKEAVRSVAGEELFFIIEKPGIANFKNNFIAVWLRLLGMLFVLLFVQFVANYLVMQRGFWKAVLMLTLTIGSLRIASYYFAFPLNFRQFDLFDPSIYGSSFVLRSLGDLLINATLFIWIVLFIYRHFPSIKWKNIESKPLKKWGLLVLICVLLIFCTFVSGHLIRTLVADSQISFDVINFFTLNIYSVIGFIVLCCISIGYFLVSRILLNLLHTIVLKNATFLYLVMFILGLIYLSFNLAHPNTIFELFVLIWLLFYVLLAISNKLSLTYQKINSSTLIFWIFLFSITITAVIVMENSNKELRNRKHYAEVLSTKADPTSETLFNTLLTDFSNEFLAINFHRLEQEATSQFFKDSLVSGNFSGYTNKYDTRVYSFTSEGKGLYNKDETSFNELNAVLNTQARRTSTPDLYYYDEAYDRFSYISKKTIKDFDGNILGFVFLLANPKKYKTDAINVELFSKGKNNAIENSAEYAFAVYNNLQLVNSHNDYAFSTKLMEKNIPNSEFVIRKNNNYDELWYKAGSQKVVVIAKENKLIIESITLFSYIFCAFLLLTGIFWILNIGIKARLSKVGIKSYWQLSIRNQIHGTVIFVSVLSFIIIGVATILFFIGRYQNSNREKLSKVIQVMENEVRVSLSELAIFVDASKIYDDAHREKLEGIIEKISEIHTVDVNLYDLDGNLQISSLPLPYTKGIISSKMNPVAYYHLNVKKEVQFFQEEKIGKLSFVSNYVPVIDGAGREYAYLNIPYFTSESKLQEEIANFLVTIINLNAFIFLIAGIIALFITNRITKSFSFISEKMKEVNLGHFNEAIDWKRDDEIGDLVKEYNKMVSKLDESALALAKSEREGAWREMARQVAHEIKNPLTPMKLSLQYLQKAISSNSDNVKELTQNVAHTLVEQINHLNQIASDFGQFANIGNPKNEKFDLHNLIKIVTHLHAIDERVHINWQPSQSPVIINADKTHINRLFNNLLQNAIQSVPEEMQVYIQIEEEIKAGSIILKVSDNGMGIPEEFQSKIFIPNFTTKTSGTGLGLAMSKGIVEEAKGNIWFETFAGSGTTFFIELPIVNG